MFGSYFIVENRDLVRKNGFFLHIVKRGIPKWTLNGEFFKKHGSFKKSTEFCKKHVILENLKKCMNLKSA